jgi:hypothetical protein
MRTFSKRFVEAHCRELETISPQWDVVWHIYKAHLLGTKRSCVSLVVFHKAVVVNALGAQILDKVDTNCPHCGPSIVETMEHIFCDYPLVQ